MVPFIIGTLMLLGQASQSQGGGVEHVLDLVTYQSSSNEGISPVDPLEIPGGIVGGVGHGQIATRQNLRVTLSSVAPQLQRAGDPFVYEVIVENIGQQSVGIPWSPEHRLFSRRMREAKVADVSLSTVAPNPQLIASVTLYGAEDVAGSLLNLAPGDRARIRAPGTWAMPADTAASALRLGSIRVGASVTVYTGAGVVGPLRSHNHLELGVQ